MSASTMLVEPGGHVAFMTDTAHYDSLGTLLFFKSKITVGYNHTWAASFMARGNLPTKLQRLRSLDLDGALELLPAILKSYAREVGGLASLTSGKLMIGGWSESRRRWAGFVLMTREELGHPAFTPIETVFAMAPGMMIAGVHMKADHGQICADIAELGLEHVARYILERQRPNDHIIENGRRVPYVVGGEGELTVVSREGVTRQTVVSWPDKVGERRAA